MSMTTTTATWQLTDAEAERWRTDGFVIRHGVFSAGECLAWEGAAEDIALGRWPAFEDAVHRNARVAAGEIADPGGIDGLHRLDRPQLYHPLFRDRIRDPRLVEPIVPILGPDLAAINTLFIFKPPRIGMGFPWHQDKFYFRSAFDLDRGTSVGTWTAVRDADVANGCLWVVPGSHRDAIREHAELDGPQQQEYRQAEGVRDEDAVPVELPAGSVLWFHSHLLHKSTVNESDTYRYSNVAHYISARSRRIAEHGVPPTLVRGTTHPGCIEDTGTAIFQDWMARHGGMTHGL